jgi:hypothetical protein
MRASGIVKVYLVGGFGVALPLAVIGPVVTVMLVGGAGVAVPVAVMAPVVTVTLVGITYGAVMGRVAVTGAAEFDGAFAPRSATAVQSMITRKAMRPWVTARQLIRLPLCTRYGCHARAAGARRRASIGRKRHSQPTLST